MANEDEQDATRLRALWKSGRDKYVSFYQVLNEVRGRIGDEALPGWCYDHLRIGLTAIIEARKLLKKLDADIVKADLAAAKQADRERRQAAKAAKRPDAETVLRERIAELERQIAEAKSQPQQTKVNGSAPLRDRREYMREFMRKKRAAERS